TLPGAETRHLSLDRDEAERSNGRIELFGVRHPWMTALTSDLLSTGQPLIEAKEVELDQINDVTLDGGRLINLVGLRTEIGECRAAYQFNFFITHTLSRGGKELPPVRRLFTALVFDDGRRTGDDLMGAKLNLAPADPRSHPETLPKAELSIATGMAIEALDKIVAEVNQGNETDLAIRHTFQAGKQSSDEESLKEELREIRERVIPILRQGKPVAGFGAIEEAQAHETELRSQLRELFEQGTTLAEQQQSAFDASRHVQVDKLEPQLISYCRYNFLRGESA
ncbi:MAG: hypothetical protein ACREDR_04080, partial [Blastocatellia bacterium]